MVVVVVFQAQCRNCVAKTLRTNEVCERTLDVSNIFITKSFSSSLHSLDQSIHSHTIAPAVPGAALREPGYARVRKRHKGRSRHSWRERRALRRQRQDEQRHAVYARAVSRLHQLSQRRRSRVRRSMQVGDGHAMSRAAELVHWAVRHVLWRGQVQRRRALCAVSGDDRQDVRRSASSRRCRLSVNEREREREREKRNEGNNWILLICVCLCFLIRWVKRVGGSPVTGKVKICVVVVVVFFKKSLFNVFFRRRLLF